MTNLVTGASGFIGSFIAEELIKKGEKVRAFVRNTSDTSFLRSINAEIFKGNLNDPVSIRDAVKGVDKIFHSAAMVGDWVPREEAFRVNVEGTRHLLEAATNEKIKRFVFISSLAVLGMRDHHKTPADAPRIKTNDIYADTKIDSEELVIEFGKRRKLPFTVVRPGFVFGPRDNKVIPRIVDFLGKGKYAFVGSGNNKINMIYVENLSDAVVKAGSSDKALGQIYNVTNDSGMSMKDLVYMVSELWGYKKPNKHIPKKLAYTICNIMEFFARARKAKEAPLLNKTRLKFLTLNLDFDNSKAKSELGYNPKINMMEGLKRTKTWMESAKTL